jgi:hypothetical protein
MTAKRFLPASAAMLPLPHHPFAGRVRTSTELQRKIHRDLRVQHPEWIEPNGDSSICDFYERRLAELISRSRENGQRQGGESSESLLGKNKRTLKNKHHHDWSVS